MKRAGRKTTSGSKHVFVAILGAALLWSCSAFAADKALCEANTQACLSEIEAELKRRRPESLPWFELKTRQLEALFQLAYYDRLREEVVPWVDNSNVPVLFQIRVSIYHAKLLLSYEPAQKQEFQRVLNHAVQLLT